MTVKKPPIRDFVYLDVERLKSILAQIEEGYVEATGTTSGSEKKVEGGAEAHVPGLAKVGGTGQYLWTSEVSETRTLHDHIYNYVEDRLYEEKRIINLQRELTPQMWLSDEARTDIGKTAFVLVEGAAIVNDYAYMKDFLTNFNKVAAAIGRLPVYDQAKGKPNAKQVMTQAGKEYQIDGDMLKDLDLVLKTFARNDLIVKILPFADHPDARAVANLDVPSALRIRLESLLYRFGSAPRGNWTLFGQIAAVPLSADQPYSYAATLGADIETALQKMFDVLRTFEPLIGSVVYPEIAITPIALYRA